MNEFNKTTLDNGINLITKQNKNTPRTAINVFIATDTRVEEKAGESNLSGRLLLQGTETHSAEELAYTIESKAIDFNVETKQDYTKIKAVFLNEKYDEAMEILSDVMLNSKFDKLDKEKVKFKGEIEANLDNPKVKAIDNYYKNLYPHNHYGNSHTRILNDLNSIETKDVSDYYNSNLITSNISIVSVGDIESSTVKSSFEKILKNVPPSNVNDFNLRLDELKEDKIVTIGQKDASQAQIIQGWHAPKITDKDYMPLVILNTILGSAGLSSRLFVELRDKKGLAYVVRSSYEALKHSGNLSVYIATAPQNIKTSLEGFKEEIYKLITEKVSEKELEDAKQNLLGKRSFFHETNSQQSHYLGYYEVMGLGAEFDNLIPERVNEVTSDDLQRVASLYLSKPSLTSILAEESYLKNIN